MADYTLRSLELLDEVDDLEVELTAAYREQRLGNPGPHAARIGDLHQRIGRCLKKADIYAVHGLRQAILDARVPA